MDLAQHLAAARAKRKPEGFRRDAAHYRRIQLLGAETKRRKRIAAADTEKKDAAQVVGSPS